jgi:hypothetical protein
LNDRGLINSTSTVVSQNDQLSISNFQLNPLQWLTNALQSLGMALQDGVASLKGIATDKITAKEMCVKGDDGEEVCLTKDQLKEMIKNTGVPSTITKTYAPPASEAPATPAPPSATTSLEVATSTEQTGVAVPAEEITPEQAAAIVSQIAAETLPAAEEVSAFEPVSEPVLEPASVSASASASESESESESEFE